MKHVYTLAVLLLLSGIVAEPVAAQMDPRPPGTMQLMFTSQPPPSARVGLPYMYTAVAKSPDPASIIHYRVTPDSPPGFGIDSISGVVRWTPPVKGWYPITIVATSNRNEMGAQRFSVLATTGNGIVQGKVQDTTGAGIPRVVIELVQATNLDPAVRGMCWFSTQTDNNGNYRMSGIEPGYYKLHAVSPNLMFASQWYDGKPTADLADRINIPDSPAVTIANFTLRAGTGRLPLLSVTGTVTDTLANALKGAEVFFARDGFVLNSNWTVDNYREMFDATAATMDFRLAGVSPHVFRALADSVGKYAVKLPPGVYVAFSRAPGYAVEYYKDKSNFLTATRIPLNRDTTGIDFTLAKLPPVALGTIKGTVLDTVKHIGVRSRIVAVRDFWVTPVPHNFGRSYTVDTDTNGVYTLDNLMAGAYIVFALPVGNYAPAFYTGDATSTAWSRATRIPINGNTVTGIDIYVREIPPAVRGYAAITGRIIMSSGPASAAAGAMVYATANATVAGYGVADELGQYSISGLAPGTYTVSADLPGTESVQSKSATVSYSSTGVPQGAVVDLGLSIVTDVQEGAGTQPESFSLGQNYPNPFNPSTVISYQVPAAGNVSLRVYDVLGREVAVLVDGIQSAGHHTASFNGTSLASGVYLYRLTAGSMTDTRKMVLTK